MKYALRAFRNPSGTTNQNGCNHGGIDLGVGGWV